MLRIASQVRTGISIAALAALCLTPAVAGGSEECQAGIQRQGQVKIVTVDEDGNRHEETFEFDADQPPAFLGVGLETADGGARVERVISDSAAERAGLEHGDVIVGIDGQPVNGPWDVTRRVLAAQPGDRMDVEVLREGSRRTLSAELGEREPGHGGFAHHLGEGFAEHFKELGERLGNLDFDFDFAFDGHAPHRIARRARLGVQLVPATPELREHLGGPRDAGVLVGRVLEGTPAEDAGIEAGDLIVGADGEPVKDFGDLIRAIRAGSGEILSLDLIRDGSPLTLDAFLPAPEELESAGGPRA